MGYNKKNDKVLWNIGKIVLAKEPEYQALHVKIMKYGNGAVKCAITIEQTAWGKDKEGTITTSKIPRLIGADLEKINKKLPAMLKKAHYFIMNGEKPKANRKPA